MTQQSNRSLMESFALERDPAVLADDVILHDQAQERSFCGREAVAAFLNAFFAQGLARTQTKVEMAIIDETNAALEFTFHGWHEGVFMGIPPTRQEVNLPMVMLCQMESGRIKQAALYYNAGTLLRQLGLAL